MNYIKTKILRFLIKHDPELCAEIFCEDFIGVVARRHLDHNALRFLQKNAGQMEPWLLHMNHQLQREQTLYGKKLRDPGFYEGAMFIVKLLYTKVVHYVPKRTEEITTPQKISNPLEGVDAFLTMKGKENGQESNSETETTEI